VVEQAITGQAYYCNRKITKKQSKFGVIGDAIVITRRQEVEVIQRFTKLRYKKCTISDG